MVLILSKVFDRPIELVVSHLIQQKVDHLVILETDVISNIRIEISNKKELIILEFNNSQKLLIPQKRSTYS